MPEILNIIKSHIGLSFQLDLEVRLRDEAEKAHLMVKDHSGLAGKRARGLTGQARFRMMEKGFEEICQANGGLPLEGSVIPGTDLRVYQPFHRFSNGGNGIILGLAAVTEPGDMPVKNMSRLAGVTLNEPYQTSLFSDDKARPQKGDLFLLLIFCKDSQQAGQIKEFAFGVIDSPYQRFEYRIKTDEYIRSLDTDIPNNEEEDELLKAPKLRLKNVREYKPQEEVDNETKSESDSD